MKSAPACVLPIETPRITVSENQLKVIKDKYLREAPSVESWLMGVVHNIALAELLFHPDAEEWDLYEGVRHEVRGAAGPAGAPSRQVLLHNGIEGGAERSDNVMRLIRNLEGACARHPVAGRVVETWSRDFFEMLSAWDFLPNSPTLMNAGRELQQLSACYVLPVPDSMDGITQSLAAQAAIQKSGGGTGFSFSRLRPKGDMVRKSRGVASGALSFMQLFDKLTDVVKQGGTRRGANMGILHYTHPEIKEFIALKSRPGAMENFNISVAVDEAFMAAVAADKEYDLINPHTKEPAGKARAKEIFELMTENAWRSGDPGLIMIDRMNAPSSNPTPALGQIESTNPCGEAPLLPWEACNLGSINLANFVDGELMDGTFNFERLGTVVALAVRFLDDVVEINNYPLPEIEALAKGNRRIGLGVMGYAEALVKMGIAYDSAASLDFAAQVMGFINEKALAASEALAQERGVFPNWNGSIYDRDGGHFGGEARAPRHCARTTIAPTGTIAIAAGLQGSGIEPFFAVAYTRYNAKALDALKSGAQPEVKDLFFEVNPLFKKIAETNDFFGLDEKELWARIDRNHKSVRGLKEVPQAIRDLFPCAHDVSIDFHVRIQAAFQKFTDNAVSKTINMANSATVADVRRAYALAHELGCKGITIYRDGSKSQQVLNLAAVPSKSRRRDPALAFGVSSEYYHVKTGYGPLHIHINYDEHGPYQVFANIPPLGTEISALTSLVGILLSKYLGEGGDPLRMLKHLNSVKGDRPAGFGDSRVDSIAHAISIALRQHLKRTGWLTESDGARLRNDAREAAPVSSAEYCPKCYSSNVSHESGCSGPTCHDCGYSECS